VSFCLLSSSQPSALGARLTNASSCDDIAGLEVRHPSPDGKRTMYRQLHETDHPPRATNHQQQRIVHRPVPCSVRTANRATYHQQRQIILTMLRGQLKMISIRWMQAVILGATMASCAGFTRSLPTYSSSPVCVERCIQRRSFTTLGLESDGNQDFWAKQKELAEEMTNTAEMSLRE
jgi:hypothetical protein